MSSALKLFGCVLTAGILAIAASKQPTLPICECVVQAPRGSDGEDGDTFTFSCQLAAFGSYVAEENEKMEVLLAPGEEALGCSPLLGASGDKILDPRFEGPAVIVRRGECSFQDKLAHVAATGAVLMILVNSEDDLIPLSSVEYERSAAAAVSVTRSAGERLIQLADESRSERSGLEIDLPPMSLVAQARARLQFLADTNAPVAVYEEYLDVAEQLEPIVGSLDVLLSSIPSEEHTTTDVPQTEAEAKELVEFFSWSAQQLSNWGFASEAALHATVASGVLQIRLWGTGMERRSHKNHQRVQAAARKLTEAGYYSQSISLLEAPPSPRVNAPVRCQLALVKFLQGDLTASLSEGTKCKASAFGASVPSLRVAQETFLRLVKLKASAHDRECLELAVGSVNDTISCCSIVEESVKMDGQVGRSFSSEFTKELFHSLVLMGVFMDELGPFNESLRFFNFAARMCQGDRTTLKLRQLLAVPVVFSSQHEMDVFVEEFKNKLQITTETFTKNQEERVLSPFGDVEEPSSASRLTLRPEKAAYLQYTITPPTMFIGYQGINVLPIQRAVNRLRSAAYPSLTSSFEPLEVKSSDDHKLRRIGFISSWFRVHSVGKLLLGIVQKLDRTKFHVTIYHCVHFLRDPDDITEAFKRSADDYVELSEDQEAAVQTLRQAQLDVVVFPELGMDEWTVLLSHHRVAPVQCVFWGHPITTGNPNIDYFISSEHFVFEHFDEAAEESRTLSGYRRSAFSEQIVLFRGLSTIFTEPKPLTEESKEITRPRLYLPSNRRLYVCPQTLMKLHPAFDEALAKILELDDKAYIVLLASDTQLVWMEKLRRRFRQRFGQHHRRVFFLPTLPFAEFQALLALADVVLDPFPFGGGVTTLDALHLGIPVVTLPAAQSVVHLAAGFLRYMNASDCIAGSLDEYVQLAISIATDHTAIRERLLSHRSDIFQDASTLEDWNTFLGTVTPRGTPANSQ